MAAPTARALPLATASPWGLPLAKPLLALLLAVSLALGASGCNAMAAALNTFQSPDGRYAFLYPTGWTRVQVNGGPQVVFHDLINSDETLSLVISEVNSTNELESLGSAVAATLSPCTGYRRKSRSQRERGQGPGALQAHGTMAAPSARSWA